MKKNRILDNYPFHVEMETRWRDLDAFGHVNNAVFATYIENARATLDIRLLPHVNPDDYISDLKDIVDDERIAFIPKRTPVNNFTSNWDTDFFTILSHFN